MRPFVIIMLQESIQGGLQSLQVPVNLFPEGDLVKLIDAGLMKTFADAIGLWMLGLGPGVINLVQAHLASSYTYRALLALVLQNLRASPA